MPGARNRAWVSCGVAVLLAAAHSALGTFTAGLPLDALPDIRLTRDLCDRALSEPKVQPLASETLQARVQRIQRLAAEGDPVGELGLAGLYAKGFGVPRSLPEAAKWKCWFAPPVRWRPKNPDLSIPAACLLAVARNPVLMLRSRQSAIPGAKHETLS